MTREFASKRITWLAVYAGEDWRRFVNSLCLRVGCELNGVLKMFGHSFVAMESTIAMPLISP